MKSPVAPFTLNATSPSFKDWLDTVPLSAPRETLRLTAAAELLILVLVSSLISNVTLPSLSTVAFVIVPSTKSKPLDNLTDLASASAVLLARYVNVWLATVSFNCFTFTASVSSVPSATSLILLPPALISSMVNCTVLPAAFWKAIPVAPPSALLPSSSLNMRYLDVRALLLGPDCKDSEPTFK